MVREAATTRVGDETGGDDWIGEGEDEKGEWLGGLATTGGATVEGAATEATAAGTGDEAGERRKRTRWTDDDTR